MAVAHTDVAAHRGSFFEGLMAVLVRVMENHPRTRQVEALNALSDEELEARGLTRQDVMRHIFRDRFYV